MPTRTAARRAGYRQGEVARMLGVHTATVASWINTGKLPTVTIGDTRFIPASALKGLDIGTDEAKYEDTA